MSKKFTKQNSQRYVVVHRPHDDPHYYDADASEHVFVPIKNPNAKKEVDIVPELTTDSLPSEGSGRVAGQAAEYGIGFDDTKYDYMQHLRPMGENPDSVFLPAKKPVERGSKKNIEDLFVEPEYRDPENAPVTRVFQGGMAKPEYLAHQQDVTDEITGFRPDMNPALREVLEALEDEAYVVNDDIVVEKKDLKKSSEQVNDDDIFAELLAGGEVDNVDDFEDQLDEWDEADFNNYEDEHYQDEMAQFDKIENLQDLQDIDYQADVLRFQKEKKLDLDEFDSDNEFDSSVGNTSLMALSEGDEEEEEEDVLGDLPTIQSKKVKGSKKRRDRKKKGAMSDISGFSMSSSAIARTETMTVLDDQYDNIINGYENYEEEQVEDEDETYQPFDMSTERSDFESLVDDFLDNYELDSGGRKIVKKNQDVQKYKDAADAVSKGKLSQRRNRERQQNQKGSVNSITNTLNSLRF